MTPRLVEVPPDAWDAELRSLGVADAYYTRGYVEASALLVPGSARFLRLGDAQGAVVFPCLVRDDPTDVVTPYGYGGPLAAGPHPPLDEFAQQYSRWCAENGGVSSFVVSHPLFGNARDAARTGFRASAMGGTIAWPLEGDLLTLMSS